MLPFSLTVYEESKVVSLVISWCMQTENREDLD